MKHVTKEQWEAGRPKINTLDGINLCLEQLYADQEKESTDIVAGFFNYEELIGLLLVARDDLRQVAALEEEIEVLHLKLDHVPENYDGMENGTPALLVMQSNEDTRCEHTMELF